MPLAPFVFKGKIMTRQTKLHKTKILHEGENVEVLFRDLTAGELGFLEGIKNDATRAEFAGRVALYDRDAKEFAWPLLMQIGQKAIDSSRLLFADDILFEMTVQDFRQNIADDVILTAITFILKALPGQSYTELLKLTPKDLIELVCICEKVINQPLLDFGEKKSGGTKLVNPDTLSPAQAKTLRQQIAGLNSSMGIPR